MPETAPGGMWEATEAIGLGGRSIFSMGTDKFCNDCCMFDNTVVNSGFEVGSLGELLDLLSSPLPEPWPEREGLDAT